MPELVSAVGGGDFGVPIEIRSLANSTSFAYTNYEPEVISFITIRIEEKSSSVMVYASGKYNIAGADSVQELRDTRDELVSILQSEFGYEIDSPTFEVRYLTVMDQYGREIELSELQTALDTEQEYDPATNPGLVYRPEGEGAAVFSIYRTGKILLTGVETQEKANQLFEDLFHFLDELFADDEFSVP